MSYLHDSDTPAGVMGQLPEDVMQRETGFYAVPDLREPASPGGSGYTVNPASISAVKHAPDTVKDQMPQGKAAKTGDGK
ncbi:hypothetical protein JCM10296v2_006211 [Rhodotorula toruloides]